MIGQHLDPNIAESKLLGGVEDLFCDGFFIDEGSVGRAEISEDRHPFGNIYFAMKPGDGVVRDMENIRRVAANGYFAIGEWNVNRVAVFVYVFQAVHRSASKGACGDVLPIRPARANYNSRCAFGTVRCSVCSARADLWIDERIRMIGGMDIEAVVLSGGASRRMGRPKRELMLGAETLLDRACRIASEAGLGARVVGEDLVKPCGPLGGIYTALSQSTADGVLFLCVDMPFLMASTLEALVASWRLKNRGVFTRAGELHGFPFIVPTSDLALIERLIAEERFSLQNLVRVLGADSFSVSVGQEDQFFNVNTAEDWEIAVRRWKNEQL